jgi:flagellar motor switch protein FliN/FliY
MTQLPPEPVEPETATPPAAVEVQEARLPEAVDTGARVPQGQFDILMDTTVEITAILGDARMPARDLLQLGPGAVVKLEKQAGEPVDLILNGVRFARGTLVVVGDRLGIRIREILATPGASG